MPSALALHSAIPYRGKIIGGAGGTALTQFVTPFHGFNGTTLYGEGISPGTTTLNWTYSAQTNCTDSIQVSTIKVEIVPAQSQACDGEQVDVDLVVTPSSAKSHLSAVQFAATKPGGGTQFDNPAGQGITISQRSSDITEWRIDNVRWHSTQADHCNATAAYEIKATYNIGSSQCETVPVTFMADFSLGVCVDGAAQPIQYFSGDIVINRMQLSSNLWHATISPGTFQRDVQANAWWNIPANSQYYSMVSGEEIYHRDSQLQNPSHSILKDYWLATNVLAATMAQEPFTGATEQVARQNARDAFQLQVAAEVQRSISAVFPYPGTIRCALETEAKNAVGASHRVAMPCTYPLCP